jgi:uroporphyrinogen-III synthase
VTVAVLDGVRVLVPRAAGQARPLVDRLSGLGAEPVVAPVLQVTPVDADELRAAVASLDAVDVVAFTSANGVRAVAGVPDVARVALSARRVVAVGQVTAAAAADHLGVRPEVPASPSTGEALAHALGPGPGTVLLPRGDLASDVPPTVLREAGWDVHEVVAYRTVTVDRLPDSVVDGVRDGSIEVVAVSSPSMVRGLVRLVGPPPWGSAVASIGPVTSAACERLDLHVGAEARSQDVAGLADAVVLAAGR